MVVAEVPPGRLAICAQGFHVSSAAFNVGFSLPYRGTGHGCWQLASELRAQPDRKPLCSKRCPGQATCFSEPSAVGA